MAQFEIVVVDKSDGTPQGRDRRPDSGVPQAPPAPAVQPGAGQEVAPGRRAGNDTTTVAVRQIAGSLATIAGGAGLGGVAAAIKQISTTFDQIAVAMRDTGPAATPSTSGRPAVSGPGGGPQAAGPVQASPVDVPSGPSRGSGRSPVRPPSIPPLAERVGPPSLPGRRPPIPPPVRIPVGTPVAGATGAAAGSAGALGGIAAAAGPVLAIVGAVAVAAIAVKKFADAVENEAKRLEDVNPQVAAARAQSELRAELSRISQGQRIGPDLARVEEFRGRAMVAVHDRLQEIKVTIVRLIEPMLPLLEQMLRNFEAGTEGLQAATDVLFSISAFIQGNGEKSERLWASAQKNMQDMINILRRQRDDENLNDPILEGLLQQLEDAGGPLFGPFARRNIPGRANGGNAP